MSADHEAYSVVIPTVGRSCLADCLGALARSEGPAPDEVVLVDDRPERESDPAPLPLAVLGSLRDRTTVVRTGGRGPAAARNIGWRMVSTPWVAFLDDDVRVSADWRERLAEDLAACPVEAAGTEADLVVPLPEDRRPTDWERNTAGLADARWVTADLAYRTDALKAVNGFDERFLRAFREDADLALRLQDAGWRITTGTRRTEHPVREADAWVSVRAQRGNADDALMLRLHGPSWWQRASAPRGRFRRHAAVTAAAAAGAALAVTGRRRAAAVAAGLWLAGTAEFAAARILPGPRTAREVLTMAATSVVIPPLAVQHRLRGGLRYRDAPAWSDR